MPPEEFSRAIVHSRRSSLSVVLGTSMNVQPAASLCDKALNNPNGQVPFKYTIYLTPKLAIINIQHTPYDNASTTRVYARTDEFMRHLMQALELSDFDQSYDLLIQMRNVAHQEEKMQEKKRTSRRNTIAVLAVSTFVVVAAISIAAYMYPWC